MFGVLRDGGLNVFALAVFAGSVGVLAERVFAVLIGRRECRRGPFGFQILLLLYIRGSLNRVTLVVETTQSHAGAL